MRVVGTRLPGFSERDLMVLTALAETFVSGDGERRARLAAEALEATTDPSQLRQLRLVLRLMDSPLANLLVAGRPATFTAMTPEARERYLLGWAHSRVPQRRSAFGAFRKLLTFLAYADTGDVVPDPRLAAIGFRPDEPPVTADLTTVSPFDVSVVAPDADDTITLDADTVVVGSGAGGGVIAAALTAAGRSVVVLEAGPFSDEASMPRKEVDAFDRHYLNHGLLTTWDGAVTMLAGTGVGGGTLVNWMTCIDAPAAVRAEWETDHGLEGVTGSAWAEDVAAIETELSVSESTHIPPKDAIILRGARALGWEAAQTRRDASACDDCGSCGFGCPRGTKQSGIRVHLAAASAAGARIVAGARVTRVVLEAGRAVGVEAELDMEGAAPRRLAVRAHTVVLAAGSLRTPAILQRSGLTHPAIGRYLRIHPVPVVAGRFIERVEMWRGTLQAARSLEFVGAEPGRNGYVIEAAPGQPGLLALALPWEGTGAHAQVMAGAAHLSPLIAITRDGGEGRATITKGGHVRLDYRLDGAGVATMRHALVRMARLARAAGATEIVAAGTPPAWHRPGVAGAGDEARAFARFEASLDAFDFGPHRGAVFSAHQMGSVRMGADGRSHPCDPCGRVRAGERNDAVIGGLYVGDGSVLPTALGVNPMITMMAMARRVSRVILAET
ncbi:MAG: GMC family oxidoreductase N-terminal domain-containing protein [Chloroflexota bacterium]